MHHSDFWRSDAAACRSNPNSMFLYNRLDILAEQSVEAWPLPIAPLSYPITVDYVMSLDEDETAITIHDQVEWNQLLRTEGSCGRYWTTKSEAPVYAVDAIINKGDTRCHDAFSVVYSRSRLPLRYDHTPGYSIPIPVLQFLKQHLPDYVGPVSLRIQEDVIVDLRLRWGTLNCAWLQQIDFVKTAPSYATSLKPLRPMTKPMVYVPCWVDEDSQDAIFELNRLRTSGMSLSLYETNMDSWRECNGYTRICVFVVSPNEVSRVASIKRDHGLT
jgi:hypothetical protein